MLTALSNNVQNTCINYFHGYKDNSYVLLVFYLLHDKQKGLIFKNIKIN